MCNTVWRAQLVGKRRGTRARERGELAALELGGGECLLELALQRPGDQTVLRLARVELALCALGLELGALQRESLAGQALLVLLLELVDRPGGRLDPGRRDRVEKARDYDALQSLAAEGLARFAGRVQVTATHARIPVTMAALAGVGDLHPSPAAPAAHEPLQQRMTLARDVAPLALAGHVRP